MGAKRKNRGRGKQPRSGRARQSLTGPQNQRFQQAVRAHVQGNLALAEAVYRSLLSEKSGHPELFNNLALVCMQSGREAEALQLLKRALDADPRFPDARLHLATLYERQGNEERAVKHYERLLSEHAGMHVARYQYANLLKAQGRLEDARAHYLKILSRKPDYTQAHFTYSGVHRYADEDDPHLTQMLDLYRAGTSLSEEGRTHLAFALAKAFEDIGDDARAFDYLEQGNAIRNRKYRYAIEGDRELFDNIIETFSPEAVRSIEVTGQRSDRPIFIVGMPRSGTTLVERILASHTDVHGGGELDYLYALGVSRFLRTAGQVRFQPLASYPEEAWASLGADYLEKIDRLDDRAARITDKLPLNFMMIGLIRIALPGAKIVHCVRDPRATCLSIYKQNFNTENYRFAYDLKNVAQFHKLYQRLMHHWRKVFPGDVIDVEYESLTREPEPQIRRLLAACGLEWQPSCLDFHRGGGMVRTASFSQVRQPIYRDSVDLWKRYEPFLGPLFDELERPAD